MIQGALRPVAFLEIYPNQLILDASKDLATGIFIKALFIRAKVWK